MKLNTNEGLTLNQISKLNSKLNKNVDKELMEQVEAYKQHIEAYSNITLAEIMIKNQVDVNAISTGKHPAVNIGKGHNSLFKNAIAGMNAILDFPKYIKLEPGLHVAAHDPLVSADDVMVWYNREDGVYDIYSYIKGKKTYTYSALNYALSKPKPSDPAKVQYWEDDRNKYRNMQAKHLALDEILESLDKGTTFQIVLNNDEKKAHWMKWYIKYAEEPYSAYLEARAEENAHIDGVRKTKNPVNRGGKVDGLSPEAAKERTAILQKLASAKKPVTVLFYLGNSAVAYELVCDPDAEEGEHSVDAVTNMIANGRATTTFRIKK